MQHQGGAFKDAKQGFWWIRLLRRHVPRWEQRLYNDNRYAAAAHDLQQRVQELWLLNGFRGDAFVNYSDVRGLEIRHLNVLTGLFWSGRLAGALWIEPAEFVEGTGAAAVALLQRLAEPSWGGLRVARGQWTVQ